MDKAKNGKLTRLTPEELAALRRPPKIKDPKKRLDCFTRHVVAKLLRTGFNIDSRQGWAFADLARALNALGATPRDLITIFQMLKQAGALHAELVIV